MDRSYLFAPGHNEKLLSKVFDAGADAVMLDLEDAVPIDHKDTARRLVAEVLVDHPAWVRVNAAGTDLCAADLEAVGAVAHGIRIPKTESPDDVRWVAERAPGKPIICAIESARGVLAAYDIARVPGVRHLAMGGVDLQRDLHAGNGNLQTLFVRSQLVVASRAAGIERPIDSVYPQLDD
jgi:citrate lyase subunit beta / citryl-CoA lyase